MPDTFPDPAGRQRVKLSKFRQPQPHATGESYCVSEDMRCVLGFEGLASRSGGAGPMESGEYTKRRYDELPDIALRFAVSWWRVVWFFPCLRRASTGGPRQSSKSHRGPGISSSGMGLLDHETLAVQVLTLAHQT